MANYKEIVTKAVKGKGKKRFINEDIIDIDKNISTILGCWVINHKFSGKKINNKVLLNGEYDVNVWYSYDNNTKTDVVKKNCSYEESINLNVSSEEDEIIVRSIKQPSVISADIKDGKIVYTVEKELSIELVGNVKVKIEEKEEDDVWDLFNDEDNLEDEIIDKEVENIEEEYL